MAHAGGRPSDSATFVDNAYICGIDTADWLIYPKTVCEILGIDKLVFEDLCKLKEFPKAHIRNNKRMYKTGEVEKYAAKIR